jgi:hypothetical protein
LIYYTCDVNICVKIDLGTHMLCIRFCPLEPGVTLSHGTELSEEQEQEGWIARPITRDAACGCHFHDALDTLLRQAFDQHTWSIEYHCVVYQHRRGLYPD